MDKYEYKLRADEIRTLAANKQYIEAMQIADTIDWRRVKSVMMLNVISEIYKMNRRYEDSKEILLLAYERHPGGRSILYSLCELSIKMEEFVQAVEYYKEFVQAAPKDMGRYILQYKLYEAQEVSLEERIGVLEEFKKRDYREKWAYELAFLYHRIGLATKCVEECDELILWFGEGKYVNKAMELKMLHEPLTPAQMEKYQKSKRYRGKEIPEYEETSEAYDDDMDIEVKPMDMGKYNTINLQQELAASMQELMQGDEQEGDSIAEAIVAPLLQETAEIASIDRPIRRDAQEVFFEEEENDTEEEVYEEEYIGEEEYEQEEYEQEEYDQQYEEAYEEKDAYSQEIYEEQSYEEPEAVFNNMLSQEYDGQISLVVPESGMLEKQITGQMSIEDILVEWEKMKQENAQKRSEEVRQRVLEQTSELFSEFDASAKVDIMEDLNRLAEKTLQGADIQEVFEEQTQEELQVEEPEEFSEMEELAEAVAEEILEENNEEIPEGEEYYEEVLEGEEYYEEEPEGEEYYEEIPEGEEYYEEEPEGEEYYEEEPEGEEYYEQESEEYYEEAAETYEQYEEAPVEEVSDNELKKLTKNQEKLFETYIASDKNRIQIEDALDKISLAPYTGNIIVTGDLGTGTLTLAKNLIKEIQNSDNNFSGKVAKISGESLNKRNVADTVMRLKNGALLVEKAGAMSNKTLESLEKALEQEDSGIIVVLEDTKKEIDKLLDRKTKIQEKFNARIDIAELNNDALVAHGKDYALELEYAIDELGVLALYTRIAEMQTSEHAVNVREVEEIVDEAIHHANKKNLSHLGDLLFGKRYDDEDMVILREKDFITY